METYVAIKNGKFITTRHGKYLPGVWMLARSPISQAAWQLGFLG